MYLPPEDSWCPIHERSEDCPNVLPLACLFGEPRQQRRM
jgi:hypothetical protein